jgi:hypothetical protein
MSTKTTFKRVALVAVAALGLGVLSVAPTSAAPTIAYGVIADSTNGQGIVGGQATVIITLDTNTVTTVAVTGVGSVLGTTQDSTTVTGTVTSGSWSDSSTTAGTVKGTQTITLTSAVAGVTTITATPLTNGTGAPGTAVTKTVTWVAATTTGSYDHAQAYITGANVAYRSGETDSTTAQLTFPSALLSTTAPRATIAVTQFNAADTTTVTTLEAAGTKAIVATITGAGAVGSTQNGSDAGASVTIAAKTATAEDYIYVYSDGRNGAATITITVNGVAVATKTVNFYGTAKSYAMSATTGETLSKKQIAIAASASGADAESATVTIKELDVLGTVMATTATTHVTSDTATIATAVISSGVLYIYGVGLGTTNINVCNTASCTSATIKLSIPITVVEKTANGGQITLKGNTVNVKAGSTTSAKGAANGGLINVGTSAVSYTQNADGSRSNVVAQDLAKTVTVEAGATLDVSSVNQGNGGEINVWSSQQTTVAGTFNAQGGKLGGNGGFVETSSVVQLTIAASVNVDTSAPMGKKGNWLLDPEDMVIDAGTAAAISLALETANVTVAVVGYVIAGDDNFTTTTNIVERSGEERNRVERRGVKGGDMQ